MIRSQKELAEIQQPTAERLTQTEKLLLRYEGSRDWIGENQRTVSFIGVGVVAVIALIFWYAGERKTNSEHAATYLSRVLPYIISGEYRHAIDGDMTRHVQGDPVYGLKYIVREFGSTESGNQAALALGNAYYSLGIYDSAGFAFDKASSDYPIVLASIEAGRAAIFEHTGNKTEAAKLLESAAHRDKGNPINGDYLLEAARDYGQLGGKNEDAIRVYREIDETYPQSQFDDAAKRELLKLNVEL